MLACKRQYEWGVLKDGGEVRSLNESVSGLDHK